MAEKVTFTPAEFTKLPLAYLISAPLEATINAHKIASDTTLKYVKALAEENPQTFKQTVSEKDSAGNVTKSEKEIEVPMLALTKVPNLTFDSLSIEFDYEISQVYSQKKDREAGLSLNAGATGLLSGLMNFGLKGGISSKKTTSNEINKSGSLSVKLHASESEMPEGLQKVISWMTQNIDEKEKAQ